MGIYSAPCYIYIYNGYIKSPYIPIGSIKARDAMPPKAGHSTTSWVEATSQRSAGHVGIGSMSTKKGGRGSALISTNL